LLIIRRSLLVLHHRGKYDLPGGTIERGEEPVETALREAREETGLNLARFGLRELGVYGDHTLFICHIDEMQPQIVTSWEHYKRPVWPVLDQAAHYLTRQPYALALEELRRSEAKAGEVPDAA